MSFGISNGITLECWNKAAHVFFFFLLLLSFSLTQLKFQERVGQPDAQTDTHMHTSAEWLLCKWLTHPDIMLLYKHLRKIIDSLSLASWELGNSNIQFLYPFLPHLGSEAYPSCQGWRRGLHPGQVACSLQHYIGRQTTIQTHTLAYGQFGVPSSPRMNPEWTHAGTGRTCKHLHNEAPGPGSNPWQG